MTHVIPQVMMAAQMDHTRHSIEERPRQRIESDMWPTHSHSHTHHAHAHSHHPHPHPHAAHTYTHKHTHTQTHVDTADVQCCGRCRWRGSVPRPCSPLASSPSSPLKSRHTFKTCKRRRHAAPLADAAMLAACSMSIAPSYTEPPNTPHSSPEPVRTNHRLPPTITLHTLHTLPSPPRLLAFSPPPPVPP
jgi:hypothetical protein